MQFRLDMRQAHDSSRFGSGGDSQFVRETDFVDNEGMISGNWKLTGAKCENVSFHSTAICFLNKGQFAVHWRVNALDVGTKGSAKGLMPEANTE